MKVLSVRQPWTWFLINGGKDVENRNWYTHYRGPLAIHAGKKFDFNHWEWEEQYELLRHFGPIAGPNDVRGAVIGVVDLVDVVTDRECDSPWKADGFEFFCWKIANPRPLTTPVLLKGQLGLFDVPDDLLGLPKEGN